MKICVYGASSNDIHSDYLKAGRELGLAMARRGHTLVFGAGDTGMMGAVARGVHEGGGKVIGIVPKFFDIEGILYPHCDELLFTKTMRERKQALEQASDGFIVTPGGIGTMDEFFEIFTLRQLDRHRKPIALLDTKGYYAPISDLLCGMAKENFLHENCLKLLITSPDPEKLLDFLESNPSKELSGTGLPFAAEE